MFIPQGIRYTYGFSVTDIEVVDEYLYYYQNNSNTAVFERKNTEDFYFPVDKSEQVEFKKRTANDKLYLFVAANWNYSRLLPVFEWFQSCKCFTRNIRVIPNDLDTEDEFGNKENFENKKFVDKVLKMLKIADFGINDLRINDFNEPDPYDSNSIKSLFSTDNLISIHSIYNGTGTISNYDLNIREESDGTRRFLDLIIFALKAFDKGSLIIADEIDANLHPLLIKHILFLFNSEFFNSKGAQLIFTTHNTYLLDLDTLRSDQIWFTEKNEKDAVTDLFSLYDFSEDSDAEIEKGYLLGRYGAIPFIKETN